MKEIIQSNHESCTGCNRCVRECPMETANITYKDMSGGVKVIIDNEKCITCGRCIRACKHDARYFNDDTEIFFNDLLKGKSISLIAAPSIRSNIPEWKKLFTYLKRAGVKKIYDVSLGADICIWAHIRYLQGNNPVPIITQPCPVIVNYCTMYRHELLENLSPVHSPMGCLSVYMKEYENITDKIAALSPCAAKGNEFESTNLADYNVTFAGLYRYLNNNNIELPENEETGFDHDDSGLGSIFPMPGGLKENIEFLMGKGISIDTAEGGIVFKRLDTYAHAPEKFLPDVFDVLNCREGCNIGTGCINSPDIFEINRTMDRSRKAAAENRRKNYYDELYKKYDNTFDISHFFRKYTPFQTHFTQLTENDIEKAFVLLNKEDKKSRNINCGACGSSSCYDMARKIALGVNLPVNCIVKSLEDAKKEHAENLSAHERLLTMERLRETDELMRTMLAANPNINILINSRLQVVDCNPAALNFFGFKDKEDFIAGFMDRMTESMPQYQTDGTTSIPMIERFMTVAMQEDLHFETDINMNGKNYSLDFTLKRISYENSFAIVANILDITNIKRREKELKIAHEQNKLQLIETERLRKEAEEANKAKSSFLSTMSHEIRTPMNAILGITEIQLQDETHDPKTKDAFEKIYNSSDMLLGIINDILDLSKIEAGKMELILDKYEIASLLSDTIQLNIMRIGSKPIEFELEISENIPLYLFGDELRVKQILNNLLSNAFKYTKKGTVTLDVSSEDAGNDNIYLIVTVTDTGQGMTQEQVDRLFDEYSRFNQKANRTTEGTGLGMAITRNLVRSMDGDIKIVSKPNKGSTFTVRILQKKLGNENISKEAAENLKKFKTKSRTQMNRVQIVRDPMPYGKVLIVDDVEINIFVAQGLLSAYQLNIDSVLSGFAAIEKIKNGNEYDIIFMDHMMPELDGIETTKRIRALGYSHPIIALTANAVAGQAEIFLGNGFDDFISKPIDVRQMNMILNRYIRDKQPQEVVQAARESAEHNESYDDDEGEEDGTPKNALNPAIIEIFLRDAFKSLKVIEEINAKNGNYTPDELRNFIIHVHGIKSALANIGKMELSACALRLETLARDGEIKLVETETTVFLDNLKKLITDLTLENQPDEENTEELTDEDKQFLKEKFDEIKSACEDYDEAAVEKAIAEIKTKKLPQSAAKLLSEISGHLLHSDFEKIIEAAGEFVN